MRLNILQCTGRPLTPLWERITEPKMSSAEVEKPRPSNPVKGGRGYHAWFLNEKTGQERLNYRRGRRAHRWYLTELGQKSLSPVPKFIPFSSPSLYLPILSGGPSISAWSQESGCFGPKKEL